MRQPVAIQNTVQQRISAYSKPNSSKQSNESPKGPSDYQDRKQIENDTFPPRKLIIGQKSATAKGSSSSKPPASIARNSSPTAAGQQQQPVRNDGNISVVSSASQGGGAANWQQCSGLDLQEQALFEQRLCDDEYGVAVRKINQNGKSNLRYIQCLEIDLQDLDDEVPVSSNRSVSSLSRSSLSFMRGITNRLRSDRSVSGRSRSEKSFTGRDAERSELRDLEKLIPGATTVKVLTWGKKKDVKIPLERFVAVRRGKTTDRTRRNACPANRILSLITNDPYNPSLDIEAPTMLDRDKFASAFSKFLNVPLDAEENKSIRSDHTPPRGSQHSSNIDITNNRRQFPLPTVTTSASSPNRLPPHLVSNPMNGKSRNRVTQDMAAKDFRTAFRGPHATASSMGQTSSPEHIAVPTRKSSSHNHMHEAPDDASAVSSITGAGFDQELVEEMQMAITTLRAELEESRAEAARAVKVAEQAIQSAEKSNSKDWNSTVTHKAAEAAALAQKKSAEALSRARLAEDKLEAERKNSRAWKEQAQKAEDEAGYWQTRAAAAEIEKAALAESLDSERSKTVALLSSMRGKNGFESDGKRSRALEAELEITHSTLDSKSTAVEALRECLAEIESNAEAYEILKKDRSFISKMQNALSPSMTTTSRINRTSPSQEPSQTETARLRSKLAMEAAVRRKLQHEVQDLKGSVRVYCRLKATSSGPSTLSTPSNEIVQLHPECIDGASTAAQLTFEFDGVIAPGMDQQEVYREVEDLCLNALDGYNSCVMTYGQSNSGKTFTMLGDVGYITAADSIEPILSLNNFGIHLRAARQLFSVLKQRSDRYKDIVTFSVVEVHEERLYDLLVGTDIGESCGRPELHRRGRRRAGSVSSGMSSAMGNSEQPSKLEIKTNHNGDTVVSGLLAVEVKCFEDVCRVWKECLSRRVSRLAEQGVRLEDHDHSCHMIGTMKVQSTNLATGTGTQGKIQFVDLAASDVTKDPRPGARRTTSPGILQSVGRDLKFVNKSVATLNDVVHARSQYQRSVPYRNSTITHVLSDSLEADTKVVVFACVSSDVKDIQDTVCTLKFAQAMRKVNIGKATKHLLKTT
eukprot:scaffold5622_cov129-Cylindrotheca_fusiformis.AAC.5